MPIYVYRCSECSHEEELLQRASDPPLTLCSQCGAEAMHKVISPVGIIFKGSGFYKTDNASGSSCCESHHHHHSEPSEKTETKTETSGASEAKAPTASPESSPASESKAKPSSSESKVA